jgi:dTDP-4-dehydrorhamnose 3,5-epimerase
MVKAQVSRWTIEPLAIADVRLIVPTRYSDDRGFFAETFSQRDWAAGGISFSGIQDNQAVSHRAGTVRGLHYQRPPLAQAKIVRVTRGAIFDVAVDLRRSSPTYGRHVTTEISSERGNQIFVPGGFAHGYCTLTPDTEVVYKVDQYYAVSHEGGLLWNDPALGIAWPALAGDAIVGERDQQLPPLAALTSPFP